MEPVLYEHFGRIEDDHWWWRGRRAIVLRLIESLGLESGRVLDVGCGNGAMLSALPAAFEAHGTEVKEDVVRRCRERGLPGVVMHESGPLPFPAGHFQVALALDVLEHLDDEALVLGGILPALEPGGALIVTVPAHRWLWTRWDDLNLHKRRYTTRLLRGVLERAGYRVEFCTQFSFVFFPLAVLRSALENLRPASESLPAGAQIPAGPVNRLMTAVFSAERHWLGLRLPLPWGSSVLAVARKPR